MSFSTSEISFPCPNCKRTLKLEFGEIKPGNQFKCPHCGANITIQGKDISKIAKEFDKFLKELKRIWGK